MKKSFLPYAFIAICFILPALLVSCNKDKDELKLDFDVTVPENWSYYILANEGWVYAAVRNQEGVNDTLRETLYVIKDKLPGYTLSTYYSEFRELVVKSKAFDSLLYETDTIINSITFKKMVSEETLWNIATDKSDTVFYPVITNRYAFYENDHGYNLLFISAPEIYSSENRALFDNIMSSFHFKGGE